jgi:hypothetical protein
MKRACRRRSSSHPAPPLVAKQLSNVCPRVGAVCEAAELDEIRHTQPLGADEAERDWRCFDRIALLIDPSALVRGSRVQAHRSAGSSGTCSNGADGSDWPSRSFRSEEGPGLAGPDLHPHASLEAHDPNSLRRSLCTSRRTSSVERRSCPWTISLWRCPAVRITRRGTRRWPAICGAIATGRERGHQPTQSIEQPSHGASTQHRA